VHSAAGSIAARLQKIVPNNALTRDIRTEAIRSSNSWLAESALRTHRTEEAYTTAKDLVDKPQFSSTAEKSSKDRLIAESKIRLATALVDQGHLAEARGTLSEVMGYFRERQAKGAGDPYFRIDFGKALYQDARAQESDAAGAAKRRALLDEAASVLGGLSQEAQRMSQAEEITDWVSKARAEGN
jgi:hypothetical protein